MVLAMFHRRHGVKKVLRVWHGQNVFGNRATVVTYLCNCGAIYERQVWGHYELSDLDESRRDA